MADFASTIERLTEVRDHMISYLNSIHGKSVADNASLATISTQIASIDSGIRHVRNGYELFNGNTEMTELPTYLDFREFTSMYKMCYECTALQSVGQLETANVTNMMWAFYGCSSLVSIDGLVTSGITSASEMFHGCSSLVTISYPLDFSSVTSKIDTTFTSCRALVNVSFSGTISVDIYMNGCSKLSVTSLLSLLNALEDGVSSRICKIGSTNLAKLTDEQKAIATDKGWTLS